MKRKMLEILLLIIFMCSLTGCGMKYPELKKDAIAFEQNNYVDEKDDNAGYLTIEYNGRIYLPYGTLNGTLKEENIKGCIGYIMEDDINDKDTRIYTLVEDKDVNFLLEYYIGSNLMNQPIFYRAIDTKDKDINIPKYIDDLEYNYWK